VVEVSMVGSTVVWGNSVSMVKVPVSVVSITMVVPRSVVGSDSVGVVKITVVGSVVWGNKSISLVSIVIDVVGIMVSISVVGEVSVVWGEGVSVMKVMSSMVSQDIISVVSGVVVSVVSINISMVSNDVVSMVSSVELSVEVSVMVVMVQISMVWDIDLMVVWGMVSIMSVVVVRSEDGILLVLGLLGWSVVMNIMVDLVVDWSWSGVVWHIVVS